MAMAIRRACFWFYGQEVELIIAGPLNEETSHFPSLAQELLEMQNCYDCEKEWPFQEVMGLENLQKQLNDEGGSPTYLSWRHKGTDLHALGLGSTLDWSQHVQVDSHPQQFPTTTVSMASRIFVRVLSVTWTIPTFFFSPPAASPRHIAQGRKQDRKRAALLALMVACLLHKRQTIKPQLSKHLTAARAAQVLQLQPLPDLVRFESEAARSRNTQAKDGLKRTKGSKGFGDEKYTCQFET